MSDDEKLAVMFLGLSDQLSAAIAQCDRDWLIERAGLTDAYIEFIEEGDTTDVQLLARLCNALNLEIRIGPEFNAEVQAVATLTMEPTT